MEDQLPTQPEVSVVEETTSGNTRRNISLAAAFLTMLLLIIAGAVFGVQKIQETKKSESPKEQFKSLTKSTIVYGYWTNKSSVIRAFDLSSGSEATIADLGKNIKHVRVINNHTISYIKDTDAHDYGKELVIRDIEQNIDKKVIAADSNFGIDDYTVSPNGDFFAVWMVGDGSGNQFFGSPSRVYTINISNNEHHLIYDETSAKSYPVHYPIAILDNGKLLTDQFVPNSGAGWGYGMSVSDFDGVVRSDITTMKNGTYSTQPAESPDGKYLGFAGYSGTDGTILVDGFRKALTVPDTVEIIDTQTLLRKKIATGLSGALYSSVAWDHLTGNLLFHSIQRKTDSIISATFSYSPSLALVTKLTENPALDFFADLDDGKMLMGQKFQDTSGVGNLGSSYNQSVNKFYVVDKSTFEQSAIPIGIAPIQFIALKPAGYFPIVEKNGKDSKNDSQRLSLQTFEIKPSLAPQRTNQQSDPPPLRPESPTTPVDLPLCRTITYPQCNQLLGTNYPTDKDIGDLNDKAFSDCVWKFQQAGEASSTCLDSPLYLYGNPGTRINIKVDTSISNANTKVVNNIISQTLEKDGNTLTFDYISRIKNISRPVGGWIITNKEKESSVEKIAKKFGFNQKETEDVVKFIRSINSPNILLSYFDHETSQNILPLYFDPTPDTYRNIVFYVKKLVVLPEQTPKEPTVIPIRRVGLTAIEISYFVE